MAITHPWRPTTAGNPFFGKMGVVIFAREELREQMVHPPRLGNGKPGPREGSGGLPGCPPYGMGVAGGSCI